MFLYELALELDVRSTTLLDRAHALGMQVDTTAQLTPDQVEQLRAAYGRGRARPATDQPDAEAAIEAATTSAGRPMGPAAVIALVAAALFVVLLVGYMVTNSGDDGTTVTAGGSTSTAETKTTTEPCDSNAGIGIGAIGQDPDSGEGGDAVDGSLPPCDVVGGLAGDEIAAASTTFVGDPLDLPRDKRQFCVAALSMVEFDGRMLEAALAEDSAALRDVMVGGRDKFKADLAKMRETAPPRIDAALERYAVVYTNLLDTASPTVDDYALAMAFLQAARTDLAYYATQIDTAVNENCDKR